MPIQTDSLNRKLYDLLDSRGYNPTPMDADVSKAGKTVAPEEADVFKFTFKRGEESIDDVLVSIDGANKLTLYYDENLSKEGSLKTADTDIDDSWFGFLKFLKKWAFSKRLSWELAPKQKINSDMAQRTYMKKKEQIAEGYYPMGNKASYSDAIPTVKIVLQHTRQIQEGEQRYRNVARIFLENTHGERILAPTTKPGIAQIYARHLAEGGVPNDERWNHIKSLCEEYGKMAGFVRAVRGNQFNESAQRLVEAGLNHYQGLRESLGKMRGHRGYTAYFESWTPTLMETEGEESNLNELFVQETLDPRIESVMPILSKLKLNLGEMKEINELAEWADNITEDEGRAALNPIGIPEQGVAEGLDPDTQRLEQEVRDALKNGDDYTAKQLAKMASKPEAKKYLQKIIRQEMYSGQQGVAEGEIPPEHRGPKPSEVPAYLRKAQGKDFPANLEKEKERNMSGPEGLAALKKRAGLEDYVGESKDKTVTIRPENEQEMVDWLESEGFDAPEPTTDNNGNLVYDFTGDNRAYMYASDFDIGSEESDDDLAEAMDPEKRKKLDDLIDAYRDSTDPSDYYDRDYQDPEEVIDMIRQEFGDKIADQVEAGADKMHFSRPGHTHGYDPMTWKKPVDRITKAGKMFKQDSDFRKNTLKSRLQAKGKVTEQGVAENLDADQKRVGQLGPTGGPAKVGDLVGANESVDPLKDMLRLLGK